MLDDLIKVTSSFDFDDDNGSVELVQVSQERDVLTLSFEIVSEGEGDRHQVWTVECEGLLEHQVTLGWFEELDLHYHHVLLWPYIYPTACVSFHGETQDPLSVVGALYQRHEELVEGWVPFTRFMNGKTVDLISGRYGMLAEGPVPLLESYAQVLERYGIAAGVSNPRPAVYTNDEFSGITEVAVLVHKQASYIIARQFNSRRIQLVCSFGPS